MIDTSKLSSRDLVKFIDGPRHDFERIVGYCSRWSDIMALWGGPDWVKKFGGGLFSVPYDGNLYKIYYTGEPVQVPFGIHTPGYAGPPNNILSKDQMDKILSARNYETAKSIYTGFGYSGPWSFERDVLRNIEAIESAETGEIIINIKCFHEFISEPDYTNLNNGYSIYKSLNESISVLLISNLISEEIDETSTDVDEYGLNQEEKHEKTIGNNKRNNMLKKRFEPFFQNLTTKVDEIGDTTQSGKNDANRIFGEIEDETSSTSDELSKWDKLFT